MASLQGLGMGSRVHGAELVNAHDVGPLGHSRHVAVVELLAVGIDALAPQWVMAMGR